MKHNVMFSAVGGRKNFLVLLVLVMGGFLAWRGMVSSSEFLEFMKWVLGLGVAGHAVEGGLGGLRKK